MTIEKICYNLLMKIHSPQHKGVVMAHVVKEHVVKEHVVKE